MKTTEAVIGRWPEVFKAFGLPPVTGKKHWSKECPLCGGKGKFRCDDKDGRGTWICTCDTGDGWKLLTLTQKKTIAELYAEVDQIIGNVWERSAIAPAKQRKKVDQEREAVLRRFLTMPGLKDTPAQDYLRSRGIFVTPSNDASRYCANQPVNGGGSYQAIWSLVTDCNSNACYLHRTLLDGSRKADVSVTKKQMSLQENNVLEFASSVAIRLFPVSSTLGIGEGIETALSCKQLYGVNTWSVINANFMGKFIAPTGVKHLIIFTDMDQHSATGHAAACACAHKNLLAKNDVQKVSVRWCDSGDFNDLLLSGNQVRELVFTRKQQVAA
ncbi:DNA primase [Salmonella enterica subsp. enterica serovar Senftenberg]|nr:DNA primase [Salmonella enterica subsp. enterica serovar Senftenberg]EDD5670789.1 DNA primase [Salmonella enterica subsp. enterica serovar Senftenberg]EEE6973006.1 DNA primase [Salmonella enterica subsp. enterica serovar Heidelberg]HAF4007276.1 DNA primase [Salmonella enterica]HCI4171304.1 toprim domain-containing protein [Salmonella enterica]